jgi:hypothetical protein
MLYIVCWFRAWLHSISHNAILTTYWFPANPQLIISSKMIFAFIIGIWRSPQIGILQGHTLTETHWFKLTNYCSIIYHVDNNLISKWYKISKSLSNWICNRNQVRSLIKSHWRHNLCKEQHLFIHKTCIFVIIGDEGITYIFWKDCMLQHQWSSFSPSGQFYDTLCVIWLRRPNKTNHLLLGDYLDYHVWLVIISTSCERYEFSSACLTLL